MSLAPRHYDSQVVERCPAGGVHLHSPSEPVDGLFSSSPVYIGQGKRGHGLSVHGVHLEYSLKTEWGRGKELEWEGEEIRCQCGRKRKGE